MTGNKPLWKNRIVLMVMMLAGCSVLVITPEGLAQVNDAAYVLRIRTNTLTAQVKAVVMKKGINNFDRVEINGLSNIGAPGQPVLPVRTVKFLIPSGQDVDDISIGWTSKKQISGSFTIEPGQHPVSMNSSGPVSITAPDPAIYASSTPFPGKLYDVVSTQSLCGYKILILNLYPVEYIPASGALFYYDTMNVLVNLKTAQSSSADPLYRGLASDRERVQSFVDNPSNAESYPRVSIASAAPTYKYVIITSSTFESYAGANNLSTLIAHRVAQDSTLTTAIVTTTWIYATYSGLRPDGSSDNATKIRNFITDYYTNNGTEYVFLVGDADYGDTDSGGVASGEREANPIVPTRGLFATVPSVPEETDSDIAADLYYACLGGTYDSDADGVYGEANDGSGGTDIDLLAEVYVGRAPVDSTTELSNFIAKTIAYENSTSDNLTKACMAGETLDDYTQGKSYLEEIRSGSSANGYTTVGMAGTGYFSFSTLYDQDSEWTRDELIAKMNSNIHILNHAGHANNTVFSKTFSNTDADSLTNTDYFLVYTQGCYSGSFDDRSTTEGSYETEDSVLEHLVVDNHGAFAAIGNSRYGWYEVGGTDGGSQRYHREFWDAVMSEGIVNMGKALQDAKQDQVGVIGDGANRWCYFTTNLLGDPLTPIHAALLAPTELTATNISFSNNSWVVLRWRNSSRLTLSGVMLRYRTDGVYPTSESDGTLLCDRSAVPGASDMFNHTDITAGTTYHYVAFGYDASNTFEGSTAVQNRTNLTILGPGSSSNSSGRSDCFIATVCYDSPTAEPVQVLRKFRDEYMLRCNYGREMVAVYYVVGPRLAVFIRDNEPLRKIARQCLQPIVTGARILIGGRE